MTAESKRKANLKRIVQSPSYRLAYEDVDFLKTHPLRPLRMQLELLKPELAFEEHNIRSTVVVFGGTRIMEPSEAARDLKLAQAALADTPDDPRRKRAVQRAEHIVENSRYYDLARQFAALVSSACQTDKLCDYVIATGGGPGLMEAANRGAYEVGAKSIGLNIHLPREQQPNSYITPELCFQFHYFAIRKLHFLLRAKALVAFPGGFGTMDELFELLTLVQTRKTKKFMPIIVYGKDYWNQVLNFDALVETGTISEEDLDIFRFFDDVDSAFEYLKKELTKHYVRGNAHQEMPM
jgi:uncharacterized protein (TIGR00730 family)